MQKCLSTAENQIINNEVAKLLQEEVIQVLEPEEGQVREKKDRLHRMILNLKALNDKVEYEKYQNGNCSDCCTASNRELLFCIH